METSEVKTDITPVSSFNAFVECCNIQNKINETIKGKDWRKDLSLKFYRAVHLEGAEAIESIPWKWWKAGNIDLDNLKVELVDIAHFIESLGLVKGSPTDVASIFYKSSYTDLGTSDNYEKLKLEIEKIQYYALKIGTVNKNWNVKDFTLMIDAWSNCWATVVGDKHKFPTEYFIKSVLNLFRQDNGYKEGTYKKNWYFMDKLVEDNVVAYYIAKTLEATGELSYDKFIEMLTEAYSKVKDLDATITISELPESSEVCEDNITHVSDICVWFASIKDKIKSFLG